MDEDENAKKSKARPSTRSGRTEGDDPRSREAMADKSVDGSAGKGQERIHPNKNRALQVARTGGRKLFEGECKQTFLEWFAATCNVKLSAEQAGINYKTAFRHRMNDPEFAEEWDRALEQGVARVKAKLFETKAKEARPGIEGDLDAPEMEDIDPAIAIQMVREHERRLAGYPKQGRAPRVASNAEVRAALVKRLAAYGVRITAGRDAGAGDEAAPDEGEGGGG